MQPLSVIIPCKNEAANILACIATVRELADEILIADSGSTDSTLEQVERLGGCRVIERDFVNSGDFKNWAIPQARHAWVLVLDADERVTPSLAHEIRTTLAGPPRYDGYWIYRDNHFMGHRLRHTSWGRDRVIRLFHRDRGRYRLHTDHAEIDLPPERVGCLKQRMVHYTCWDYDDYLRKLLHYSRQQAEIWHRQGRRPSWIKLLANGPLRFLRCYVLHAGFLDGRAGFQVAMLTGFYSFLKQARLWQMTYGLQPSDIETRVDYRHLAIVSRSSPKPIDVPVPDDRRRSSAQPSARP